MNIPNTIEQNAVKSVLPRVQFAQGKCLIRWPSTPDRNNDYANRRPL